MSIKLDFDLQQNPQTPTFVLATRNGTKIGQISNITGIRLKGAMKNPEGAFTVHKYDGDEVIPYWDDIKDFKLVWCKELDTWFEIKIDASEADDITKQVSLQRLGEAELSQIKLYGMEVNTEDDILRDDYVQPTVFYNADNPTASLMHRMLEKAPHYRIRYIDEHLKGIQKIFSFNDKDLKGCFEEIEESMDVIFVFKSKSEDDGTPDRTIDVFDLKSYCPECGARGDFVDKCLNCYSKKIITGYGVDTGIFVSSESLGQDISIKVNTDEVKNCYRLEGGDDLMTATIRNCNPNGTSYIWDFSETTLSDMDNDLIQKIWQYEVDYDKYKDTYVSDISSLPISDYNTLVDKYTPTSDDLKVSKITSIVGYAPIMQYYYDTIDFAIYLESGLLPNINLQDTNAQTEAAKLTAENLSPVAVVSNKYITLANASTVVLNAAKIASDPRYQIKINQESLNDTTWTGNFTVTNYSDEKDTCISAIINVTVNDDYSTYVDQKLKNTLYNGTRGKYGSITQMIDMDTSTFQVELKKYNLTALSSINTCFTECIKLLSEQGVDQEGSDLYNSVYLPVYNKISYIQSEITVRENEIATVQDIQNRLLELKGHINNKLDLETYLGTNNWLDFSAYRREETYSNGNYISDHLNNKELFERAEEFMEMAEYEISKSANFKHEISSTLRNLFTIEEFKKLVDYFECGNWIRIIDDDGEIYKLRLVDYEIDFDNLDSLTVTFSDVVRTIGGLEPVREILVKSTDIINNYNAAMNKTNSNFESINDSMSDMVTDYKFNTDLFFDSTDNLKDNIYIGINKTTDSLTSYVTDVSNDLHAEITLKVDRDNLASEINLVADDIILSGNTKFTNGSTILSMINNAQSSASSVSTALETYKTAAEKGETTINGGCIKTGFIDSACIKTDYFTTQAANGVAGWTIKGHPTDSTASYICGNNSKANNVVLKTGGGDDGVAFACGLPVGYTTGQPTTGALARIFHNGRIDCSRLECSGNINISGSININGGNVLTAEETNQYYLNRTDYASDMESLRSSIPTSTNQLTGDFREGTNGTYVALANSSGNHFLATTEWVINYVTNKMSELTTG